MANLPTNFLQETKAELMKVTWPTKQELIRLTSVVILSSAVVGFFIGGLDIFFTKIMETIIK